MYPMPDLSEYQQPEFIAEEYKKKYTFYKVEMIISSILCIGLSALSLLAYFIEYNATGLYMSPLFFIPVIIVYFINRKYCSVEYIKKEISENHLKKVK